MYRGLRDKIVIVTGANGLIGKEVIKHLEFNKAIVIAVDVEACDKVLEYDVTKPDSIDVLISYVMDKYKRIDGLVNLAYPRTSDWGNKFEDVKMDSWRINVDMQLNAIFYINQSVLKIMKNQKKGSIVNIGSIYGVVGNDFELYKDYGGTSASAYSAIKGGIINFSRYLASYYGKHNVRINCVSPGGILDKKQQHPSFIQKYSEKSPLGRLGDAFEIAPPISFLISDDSSFITGHNLMVDGGWTAI
ncbi:SDR family oxidoreductase [uncultured Nonlabens sp.]|uniref:SDR family oxidoreductase n=1 Tax=uncultured Nonlabens sp. TaxID=859306 RepID=UPI00260D965B|nr:SDR family oxidoreductase [uncultured Nonlabens sp.]